MEPRQLWAQIQLARVNPVSWRMPGRWVGGKGSVASPVKDQLIEGQIVNEDGESEGNILILIKRIYSPGELGRFVLGDYVVASALTFRRWIESDEGKVTQVDGSYHFCKVDPKGCAAQNRNGVCVHIGKWRVHKEDELVDGGIKEFGKAGNLLISQYFKKGDSQATPSGGLPWGEKKSTGGPKVAPTEGRRKAPPEETRGDAKEKGAIQKAIEAEGKRRKAITQLEKQLAGLKKKVRTEEGPETRRKKKRKKGDSSQGSTKEDKKDRPFEGEVKKRRKKPVGDSPSPDWGGDDDDEEDEDDESSDPSDESSEPPGESSDKDDKKRRKKGKKPSDGEDDKDKKEKKGPAKKVKKKKKRRDKKKKKKRKGPVKTEKDKGPFGVGESRRMVKDSSSSDDKESGESGSSSQSFRKAPSGLTLHLRLQRYAMKHPGRLASRLLQKMERATRFEGARRKTGYPLKVVPCAVNFYLAILTPSLKDKWSPRTQRELRIWTEVLDCLASKEVSVAADIAAQRIKALEQSVQDNNQWRKAKYLELVDSDEVTLADKGEANMMQKEVELEEKLRGKGPWQPPTWERKGKGGKEGKDGKGKVKGKKETPAAEAAKK